VGGWGYPADVLERISLEIDTGTETSATLTFNFNFKKLGETHTIEKIKI